MALSDLHFPKLNLMKNLFLLAVLAVAGLTDAVAQKLGHLDVQEILLTLPERAEAQTSIEAAAAERA